MTEPGVKRVISELQSMKHRMDALYTESVEESEKEPKARTDGWEPSADVFDSEDEWLLIVDLPGVAERDLHLEIADGGLIVRGKRESETIGKGFRTAGMERPKGSFSRVFAVPDCLRVDAAEADLRNGVLTVRIGKNRPKDETPTRRKIVVRPE